MRGITVRKEELLKKLQENRATHQQDYTAAHAAWHLACVAKLEAMLYDAKVKRKVEQYLNLPEPQVYTKEYDREIGMLELHTEDTIGMSAEDYRHYIEDDWDWKHAFAATNSQYLGADH